MSRFKAVAQLEIPPRFEYRISIQPTAVSLSNPTDITASVEVTLKAASVYTIYSERLTDQPHVTVLHDHINLFCFDLVDLDTQEVISGEARDVDGTRAGAPAFPANLVRERFREFLPERAYHTKLTFGSQEKGQKGLQGGLRLEDPETLVGRRLGLRLRPMDTWWVEGTIDKLFAGKDTVAKDIYKNPLLIQSADCAPISIKK
jgi:hypothetical protein